MALQLNQQSFSGLGALAGRQDRLDLPVPDYSPLLKGASIAADNLQNAGKLKLAAIQASMGDRRLSSDSPVSGMRIVGNNSQGATDSMSDVAKAEMLLQATKQKAQQDMINQQMKNDIEQKKAMGEQAVTTRGNIAAAYMMAIQNSSSPQEKEAIKQKFVDKANATGIYKQSELDAMSASDPKTLYQLSLVDALNSKAAMSLLQNEKIGLAAANGGTTGGGFKITTPGGASIEYAGDQSPNVELDKKVKADVQTAGINAEKNLMQLKQLGDQYQKDFLGAGGETKAAYLTGKQWLSSLPIIGDVVGNLQDKDAKWLEQRQNFSTLSNYMALDVIKQLSGVQYSDKQLEFLKMIIPKETDPESVWKGKWNALMEIMDNTKKLSDELISKGYTINSQEYKERVLNDVRNKVLDYSVGTKNPSYISSDGKTSVSMQNIQDKAKELNKSPEEIIKMYNLKGVK